MSFEIPGISGKLGLDNSPLRKAVNDSIAEAKRFKAEGEKALNAVSVKPAAGQINELTDQVGKLNQATEKAPGFFDRLALAAKKARRDDRLSGETALGGFAGRGAAGLADYALSSAGLGGPAIILESVAKGVDDAIKKVRELNQEVKNGSMNWADVAMEVGKTLPVFGAVFKLGETINDVFTGNKTAIEENAAEMKFFNEQMKLGQEFSKAIADATGDSARRLKDATTEASRLFAILDNKPQVAQSIADLKAYFDKVEAEEKAHKGRLAEIDSKFIKKIEPLQDKKSGMADQSPTSDRYVVGTVLGTRVYSDTEQQAASADRQVKDLSDQIDMLQDKRDAAAQKEKENTEQTLLAYDKQIYAIQQLADKNSALGKFKDQLKTARDSLDKTPMEIEFARFKKLNTNVPIQQLTMLKWQVQQLKIDAVQSDLQKQIDGVGKAPNEAKIDLLAKDKTVSAEVINGLRKQADLVVYLTKAYERGKSAAEALKKEAEDYGKTDLQKQIDDLNRAKLGAQELADALAAVNSVQQNRVTDQIKALEKELSQARMTDRERRVDDIINDPNSQFGGQKESQIDLVNRIDQAQKDKALSDELNQKAKDLQTPAEKFNAAMERINEGFMKNMISGDDQQKLIEQARKDNYGSFLDSIKGPEEKFQDQMKFLEDALAQSHITSKEFDLGVAKARKDAFGEQKLSGLVTAGSAQAQALRFDAKNQAANNDPVAIQKQQLKELRETKDYQRRTTKALENVKVYKGGW